MSCEPPAWAGGFQETMASQPVAAAIGDPGQKGRVDFGLNRVTVQLSQLDTAAVGVAGI